jgi:hypothetical protein
MSFLSRLKSLFSYKPPEIGSVWVLKNSSYKSPWRRVKRFKVLEIKDGWIRLDNLEYTEELHVGFKEFDICFEPYKQPVEQSVK